MNDVSEIGVLHVDDEPGFADVAADFLEREDDRFDVETVSNASDGLAMLADRPFDCVVSDYDMPGTDGIEFLTAVREEFPELPFILFTGKGSEEVASEAISASVTDYLQKGSATDQYVVLANRIVNAVERYRAEQELERQNDLFQRAQEITDAGAWEYDLETGDVYLTENVYELHDIPPDFEPTAERLLDRFHPDDRPLLRDAVDPVVTEGDPDDLEVRLAGGDGDPRWVRIVADPQLEGGEVVRVRGVVRDITERKTRERNLEESKQRYQSLFENNPLVIWEEDFSAVKEYVDELDQRVDDLVAYLEDHPDEVDELLSRIDVIDVNRNALEYYDADSKAELMENLDRLMTEESLAANRELWASIADGDVRFRAESVSQSFAGERRHEILEMYTPEAHADDYSRVYITATDITEPGERER